MIGLPSREELNDLNLPAHQACDARSFSSDKEHYRLLHWLSRHVPPGAIFDIGSHYGDSALALSSLPVYSFDIEDRHPLPHPNVAYVLSDLFDPAVRDAWSARLLTSPLIFIDVDPHEGTREIAMVRWLQHQSYAGLIVLDDILWPDFGMREQCWERIEDKYKVDATSVGHQPFGTGIVCFQ